MIRESHLHAMAWAIVIAVLFFGAFLIGMAIGLRV